MKNVQKEKNEIQTKQEKIISTILCHQWKKKTQPNTVITECHNLQISTAQFCHLKYELPLKVAGDCFRQ